MKNNMKWIYSGLLFYIGVLGGEVQAQEVFVDITGSGTVVVSFNGRECIANRPGWDNQPYEIKYKKTPSLGWQEVFYQNSSAPSGVIIGGVSDFEVGQEYKVKVRYYGLRRDCRGRFNTIHTIGEAEFLYDYEQQDSNEQTVEITDDHVRIQHLQTSKCLYTYTPGGLSATRTYNFSCWDDPNFAFELLAQPAPDVFRLRMAATGHCLQPVSGSNGAEIGVGSCGSSASDYQIVSLGGPQMQLKNVANGKCLYGNPVEAGLIHQWACWGDPAMTFIFETY